MWGGRRTPTGDAPWTKNTMVLVNSTTKGLAAMTIAVANSRGWIEYDAPVAEYWPEFAQRGKAAITVRQLLSHEAGLVWIDEPLHFEDLRDLDYVAGALAKQKPAWKPGTRHGYHAMTIGLYMQELIRHADPARCTLGRFFHEEIAEPLGIDFYIGLPSEVPDERLAQLRTFTARRSLRALPHTPAGYVLRILWPWSLLRKSMLFADVGPDDRAWLEVEVPAGNGVGTARAIARAYSAFAEGGTDLGLTPETLANLMAPTTSSGNGMRSWERPAGSRSAFSSRDRSSYSARARAHSALPARAAHSASPTQTHGSASPT